MWWQKYTTAAALVRCTEVQLEVSKQSYSGESCQQTDMKQCKMKPSPNDENEPEVHMWCDTGYHMWYSEGPVNSGFLCVGVWFGFFNTSNSGNDWYLKHKLIDLLQTSI